MINPVKKIMIVFIDEFGNKEAGIDENGLYKEFMVCLLYTSPSPRD